MSEQNSEAEAAKSQPLDEAEASKSQPLNEPNAQPSTESATSSPKMESSIPSPAADLSEAKTPVMSTDEALMSSEIYRKVKDIIIEQLNVEDDQVSLNATFKEDLKADSLDLVELIMAFEEEFGGEISDKDAEKITTVGQAVRFLQTQGVDKS